MITILASGTLWAASKTNKKASASARRHKKIQTTSTHRPKPGPSKSPKAETPGSDFAALPDPDTEGSTLLGIYSIRSGSAIVPFMAKPTGKQQPSFALPPGTSGIKIFSKFYSNESVLWYVAQFGERLAWVDILLVKAEPNPSPQAPASPPMPHRLFFDQIKEFSTLENWAHLAEVLGGLGLIRFLIWIVSKFRQRHKEKVLAREFHYFSPGAIVSAARYYVPTHICEVSSTDADEPIDILSFANRERAIPSLLNRLLGKAPEESDRYFLILADSGFGKTTLLLNLAFAYSKRAAQTSIKMLAIPLGDPNANKVIDEYPMAERIRTILLLDAFDEDPQATPNYQQRLKELMRSTLGFRQIVITCRTQFFPSADERPTLTGTRTYGVNATFEQFTPFFIAPFDDHDVQLYLKKRFPFPQWSLQKKAEGVVYRARNLVARPMLLAHVDVLVRQNRDYKYSIEIYDAMVTHWLASESVKVGKQRYGECLRAFSKRIAVNIWEHRIERRGLYASVDDIEEVAKSSKVDLDVLTKHNISSRSLLNGTGDGKLKFSHQTILEYFLAAVAFEDTGFLARLDEAQYANAGRVKVFLRERVNLPFPDGRGLTMPFADLLIQLYAGKDPYPGVPFLIGHDSEFRMICWTTTPPSMVRMVSLASNRITVHICYRPEYPIPSSLAAQWAEEAFRDERIAHVQLCGTHRASSQPMMDSFVDAFQRRGIPRRLEVEHVEDFVR